MHNHWTKLVDWTSGLDWWTQLKSLSVSTLLGYEAITTVPALSTDLEPSRRYLRLVSSTDPSYHALLENWRGLEREKRVSTTSLEDALLENWRGKKR